MLPVPFHITDWEKVPVTNHPGLTGSATWRTLQYGDLRVRMVEYSAGYVADHWCMKGHLLFCLEGSMTTELSDGTSHELKAGMSYQVTDNMSSHRSVTDRGAKLIIVDGGFLNTSTTTGTIVLDYIPAHQPWFERLNRAWIEKHFWMEPVDIEVLQHPDQHIIARGGSIFMATHDGDVAGTVALRYVSPGIYEFTKMAVDEKFQGKKIGKILALAAIQRARKNGASKVILYSNTKLETAIHLYRKLGFIEVPVDGIYKRSNIKMELNLKEL